MSKTYRKIDEDKIAEISEIEYLISISGLNREREALVNRLNEIDEIISQARTLEIENAVEIKTTEEIIREQGKLDVTILPVVTFEDRLEPIIIQP